jgi:hypothetical protein
MICRLPEKAMWVTQSGKVTFKAILYLAFLGAVAFAGLKIIPVYVNNYQLKDYVQTQTPYWLTQRVPAETIRKNILSKAQELDLPVEEGDVTVESDQNRVAVSVDYHAPVDLKVYTVQLHFTDSSENRSII